MSDDTDPQPEPESTKTYTIDMFILSDTVSNANMNTTAKRFITSSNKSLSLNNPLTNPTVQVHFKLKQWYRTAKRDMWGNWSYRGDSPITETDFIIEPNGEKTITNKAVVTVSSSENRQYRTEITFIKVIEYKDDGLGDTKPPEPTDDPDTSTVSFFEKYKVWLIATGIIISVMVLIFFLWKKGMLPGVN